MQITFNIARNWNELNDWQLKKIASELFSSHSNERKSFLLTFYLFASSNRLWSWVKLLILLLRVPSSQLKTYASFLYKTDDLTRFPKKICSGFGFLYGPADRLSNITINEYAHADLFYYRWRKTKNVQDLNRLVSVLYRPKAKEGHSSDKRRAFNGSELKFHARRAQKLSLKTKRVVAMAFQGSRTLIVTRYKHVFKRSTGGENYVPLTKIIASMAGGDPQPFGDFYKTKQAGLYDFFDLLNDQIKEQNEWRSKSIKP